MGFLQKFERKIETIIGDGLARVFGGKVQLQEITFALRQQARKGTVQLSDGTFCAPYHYDVYISSEDRSGVLEKKNISLYLAADLKEFIQGNHWKTTEPISVFLKPSMRLHSGQFRAKAQETLFTESSHQDNTHSPKENTVKKASQHRSFSSSGPVKEEIIRTKSKTPLEQHTTNSPTINLIKEPQHAKYSPPLRHESSSRDNISVLTSPPVVNKTSDPLPLQLKTNTSPLISTPKTPEPIAPQKSKSINAIIYLKSNSDKHYTLQEGSNILGRGQTSDFQIPDSGVSRKHVDIVLHDQKITVLDLGSTNGTSVNGIPIQSRVIKDGDIIKIGHSDIVLKIYP